MKILLISGFLGAGKTSFIKALSKNTGRDFVIVENEFGNVDIDGQILKQDSLDDPSNAEMKVWELAEGCICCSLNLDFAHSVLTIANSLNPDYLVVEPSGVALPGNIINELNKISYEKIDLLPPITIIDAEHYKKSSKDFSDYFKNQLDSASRLVVSKSENMSEDDFLKLKHDLKIGDDKLFPSYHYSKWDKKTWFEILKTSEKIENMKKNFFLADLAEISKTQELENISLKKINVNNPLHLMYILDILVAGPYGRIIRGKGYFKTKNDWLKFDFIDGTYSITQSEPMNDNRLVIIGKNLNKAAIKFLFENKSFEKFKSLKISKVYFKK